MKREDLLGLTPDALAQLFNRGLVKRAQRELEKGMAPTISETPEGVVTGEFADGIITTIVPGHPTRDSTCSCKAAAACRHKVIVILAYANMSAPPPDNKKEIPGAHEPAKQEWSPSCFTTSDLETYLGKPAIKRAKQLLDKPLTVSIDFGDIPAARLPICNVRFLVPNDLSYAACDCARPEPCEHIAIAVWAFQEAKNRDTAVIELGKKEKIDSLSPGWLDVNKQVSRFLTNLIMDGAVHSQGGIAQQTARLSTIFLQGKMVWLHNNIAEIKTQLKDYRTRSADYSAAALASLVTELKTRCTALENIKKLPAAVISGSETPPETLLEKMRLVSLGARVSGDMNTPRAQVYLADPDSATILVLEKEWENLDLTTHPLADKAMSPGITLGQLAGGQLVTSSGKRLANRRLIMGRFKKDTTIVKGVQWHDLPYPVLVQDLGRLVKDWQARPPRYLRPRLLAEQIHVVEVGGLFDIGYSPGTQTLRAHILDKKENPCQVELKHRGIVPGAIDIVGNALSEGKVKYISGKIKAGPYGLVLEPVALYTHDIINPDLEAAASPWNSTCVEIPEPGLPILEVLYKTGAVLEQGIHMGLRFVPMRWTSQLIENLEQLEKLNLRNTAFLVHQLIKRVRIVKSSGTGDVEAAASWLKTYANIALMTEAFRTPEPGNELS